MTRDVGHAGGSQTYLPAQPPCDCGHLAGAHIPIIDVRRGACYVGHTDGRCTCKQYSPELAPAERAAEQTAPGRGVQPTDQE